MPGLDFLDGANAPDASTPVVEPVETALTAQPAETTEQPSGPVRGPDGKFVAKTPAEPAQEPAQAQQPEPAPQQAQQPEPPQHAPLTALLDERERRQAAEQRTRQLEEENRRLQPRQEQQAPPDPYEDPEGFAQFQQARLDQRIYQTNLQWSRRIAEVQNTPEIVAQAHDWGVTRCNEDPFFNQKVQTSPDPYGYVIAEWKREQLLTEMQPDDLTAFRAWKAQQSGAAPAPAQAAPPSPPSPPAPRSIATATSAGGAAHVPVGPGTAWDALPI